MDKVTISFQYEPREYIKAFRKYLFLSKIIKKIDLIILGILSVLEIILIIVIGLNIYSFVLGFILSFFAMILGILYFYQPINIYRRTPKLRQVYKLTFSKNGIAFKTNTIDSSLLWGNYTNVWDCKDFYYLIQDKRIYTILPKRVFQENNIKTLERIIQSAGLAIKKYE